MKIQVIKRLYDSMEWIPVGDPVHIPDSIPNFVDYHLLMVELEHGISRKKWAIGFEILKEETHNEY